MGQGHERQPYGSANPLLAGVARDPRGRKTVSRGFILILVVLTVHLASPQLETVWSVFETPGDAARLLIGLLVCLWLVVQLFTAAQGCRSLPDLVLSRPVRDPAYADLCHRDAVTSLAF
jgi:hypothetical protein